MPTILNKPPIWYWILSIVALIWYGLGVNQYFSQTFDTVGLQERYTAEQVEIMSNTPTWAIVGFAIAVFFGLIGSIALLLRKKWAYKMFFISFIGVIAEMFYSLFIVKSLALYGSAAVLLTLMIIVFGIFYLIYSKIAIRKKWIG